MSKLLALVIVLAAAPASADPELVATARVGVAHFVLENPLADDYQIPGTGATVAAQLGLAFKELRIEPSVAVEVSQFTSPDYEGFQPVRDIRERLVSATARLRYSITDYVDVTAGLGGAITFEHKVHSNRFFGYRYELAVGVRLWHDGNQAIRLEGAIANTHFNVPGANGVDFSIVQLGGSLGYAVAF